MKTPLKILLILVGIVILALISVPLWIDSVAKGAVETGAGQALGVPTALGGIDIGLLSADCSLEGLEVANPEGYKDSHFLKLSKGYVSISVGSLMGDEVRIPELMLEGIEISLERQTADSNYGTIMDNLEKLEKEAPKQEEPGKKFVIDKVTIRDVRVTSRFSVAGVPRPAVKLTIPEITFENLGSEEAGGVVMSKMVGELLKAILTGVFKAGKGVLPDEITDGLGKGLEGLGDVGGAGLKILGEGGKAIGGVAGGVVEGIGGIFGGKKKDEEEEK